MEQKIAFKCRIIRLIDNGIIAVQNEEYIVKFQDIKLNENFKLNDDIIISVEDVDEQRTEISKEGYLVIYCILKSYLPNGIQFIDCNEPQKGIFWKYRGLLIEKSLENNEYWEKNTILRIMAKRLDY